MEFGWIFVLMIIFSIFLFFIIRGIMTLVAMSKGKIDIFLDRRDYSPGEIISGSLILEIKKPVYAKGLFIGIEESQTKKSGRDSMGRKGVFYSNRQGSRFSSQIEGEREYPVGRFSVPFSFQIPEDINRMNEGALGVFMKTTDILSKTRRRTSWFVSARLDIPGKDIFRKVRIRLY